MVMFPIFIEGGSSCASGILGLVARANRAPEKVENPSMVDGIFNTMFSIKTDAVIVTCCSAGNNAPI